MIKTKNFFLFLGLILLDQVSKLMVVVMHPSLDLKLLAVTYVQNTGAVWGLFSGSNKFFIWFSIIAIGVLIYSYDKFPKNSNIFLTLLFAGIVGNLIDRLFRGFVIDFIDFKIWPVFNMADAFITVGVFGMIFCLWREK